MIPLLEYKDQMSTTLEINFVLGSVYFFIKDKVGRKVLFVFSGSRAREFVRILSSNERTEVSDNGDGLMCFQPLNSGGFGITIASKGISVSFIIDRQPTEELINWFQMVHNL